MKTKAFLTTQVMRLSLGLLFIFSSACSHSKLYEEVEVQPEVMKNYLQDKPEPLHPYYEKVLKQGEHNFVLWQMEAGLAAMELGDDENAAKSFDDAISKIEMIYKENDENAEKALSVWHQEGMKDFKGEPYERAMTYYYRGILYLKKGDLENARASFKNGLFQDARAVDGEYQQDFALLTLLVDWTSQLLNDPIMAQQYYQETQKYNPSFTLPAADHNAMILIEAGDAPKKIGKGKDRQTLVYNRGDDPVAKVNIVLGDTREAIRIEDIYAQASTRGERVMDEVNNEKAETKKATNTAGDTAIVAGAITTSAAVGLSNYGTNYGNFGLIGSLVGLGMSVGGLMAKGAAAGMETEADTRHWTNLPDIVYVLTSNLTPNDNPAEFTVIFNDAEGSVIPNTQRVGHVQFVNQKYGVAWMGGTPSAAASQTTVQPTVQAATVDKPETVH